MSSAPLQSEVLTTLQVWIALQYLGALTGAESTPPDLDASPAAVSRAGAGLVARGLLVIGPDGTVRASPALERLLKPAAFPQVAVLAAIQFTPPHASATQTVTFGATPDALTVNWVDASGLQHFNRYALEAWQEVLAHLLIGGEALRAPSDDAIQPPPRQRTVILSGARQSQGAAQDANALIWIETEGGFGLLAPPRPASSTPGPRAVSREELVAALAHWLSETRKD